MLLNVLNVTIYTFFSGKWACSACLGKGKTVASLSSTKQVLVIEDEDGNDNKMDIVPVVSSSEQQGTAMVTVTTTITPITAVEVLPVPSAPRRVMDPNVVQGIFKSHCLQLLQLPF